MGFKAGSELVRFPAWVQFFVSGVTCSARAPSVVLVWRLEMAAWRHRESSPPQPLTSWLRYGFGTVLDPLRWLVSLRESPAGRLPGQPCARLSAQEFRSTRELQEGRERARRSRVVFKQSVFWTSPKAAGPIRASVRGGAPPARLVFCKAFSMEKRITFDPCIKLLSSLHIYNITTFVIVLIYEILQPFIKV